MLYKFQIELSDIDRGIYETLEFRTALHPSESTVYLLSRVLAYVLNFQRGLDFSPSGLGDPEAPALQLLGPNGVPELFIEIGNPPARKLHKASKHARKVLVYTYKNPRVLLDQIKAGEVHRAQEIGIFSFDPDFMERLEKVLEKSNRWTVLCQQGQLSVTVGAGTFESEVQSHRIE